MNSAEPKAASSTLVADVFPALPGELDTSRIRTAAQYRTLIHLLRPLTQYDRNAQIEANLAERWEIEDDFKLYRFHISKAARWSNGDLVTAREVKNSIDRQVRLGTGTHFVFTEIKEVRAPEDSILEVALKNRNPHFLRTVTHPEFGPTRLIDGKEDFSVSSGPYVLASTSAEEIVLGKNPHFTGAHPRSPDNVRILSSQVQTQVERLRQGAVHFITPSTILPQDEHARLASDPAIQTFIPHVGYTYWLAINPDSAIMRKKEHRLWLAAAAHSAPLGLPEPQQLWQRAHQLVLPDASGRIPEAELDRLWADVQQKGAAHRPEEIHLLLGESFAWNAELIAHLKKQGVRLKISYYKGAADLEPHIKSRKFDAMLINNDFSSAHMLQSLTVTLNPSRPLVFAEQNQVIAKALRRAMDSPEPPAVFESTKEISSELIREGLIAPLVYNRRAYYALKGLDLSRLSPLQSDLCFWKMGLP